ncbi:SPOSA6832_03928 [Sporobolomyces salmonicolor]|uniref:SPOSA6832_03928-mRNA-1:cds n=1 Tax=Sporidiobolus salmonicolor TaxID=5005 RepID=A0A0D6ERH6_SPOSA|nr:SPOSA6832_03928 [Sporobolomyces salmonicolor]
MLPRAAAARPGDDASCNGSAASSDDFARTVLSSSGADLPVDDHDFDRAGDASEPLLPQYRQKEGLDDPPDPAPTGQSRLTRVAVLAVGFAAVAGLLWAFVPAATSRWADFAAALPYAPSAENDISPANDSLSTTQQFLLDSSSTNTGIIPFPSSLYSPHYTPQPLRPTLSTSSFPSSRCVDLYVSRGVHCAELRSRWSGEHQPKLDIIWTWTNGSSGELMASWREKLPHWIALPAIEFSETRTRFRSSDQTRLKVHPHSELFKSGAGGLEQARHWQDQVLPSFNSLAIESQLANIDTEATTALYLNDDFFLLQPLSVADVESPLSGPIFRMQRDLLVGGVAPEKVTDDGDGEWRGLDISAWLLGAFDAASQSDNSMTSSQRADERFGKRRRPYLIHVAKTVSIPMLKEMQSVFLDALTKTAEARFRGKAPIEVQTMYLYTMYTVEKHREALLWSFLIARSHPSLTGVYTPSEREALLSSLGYDSSVSPSSLSVAAPHRNSLVSLHDGYRTTGLARPKETDLEFTSQDGYAFFGLDGGVAGVPAYKKGWPSFNSNGVDASSEAEPVCTLNLTTCFGSDFLDIERGGDVSVQEIFRRVAFERPQCGDCVIALLVGRSGEKGLEAFVPPPSEEGDADDEEEKEPPEVNAVGMSGTKWSEVEFDTSLPAQQGSRRRRATSLIHRYAYTIGTSPASFKSIRYGGASLTSGLDALSSPAGTDRRPAFVALNDDVAGTTSRVTEDVDRRMGDWFRTTWPDATRWEARNEGANGTAIPPRRR